MTKPSISHRDALPVALMLCVLTATVVNLLVGCGGGDGQERHASNTEVDISTLAARYEQNLHEAGRIVYGDFEKLCRKPDPRAVPKLAKILAIADKGGITEHYAAEALACIGTREAHEVLAWYYLRHAKVDSAFATHAFDHMVRWEMDDAAKSNLIERYLLRNLSKHLQLTLSNQVTADGQGKLTFMVQMKNLFPSPVVIVLWLGQQSQMLYLRNHAGQYVSRFPLIGGGGHAPPRLIRLNAGESYDLKVTNTLLQPQAWNGLYRKRLSASSSVWMNADGSGYDLVEPGRFTVRAMLEHCRMDATDDGRLQQSADKSLPYSCERFDYEQWLSYDRDVTRFSSRSIWAKPEMRKAHEQDAASETLWWGRVVSNPVEIEIPVLPAKAP